MNKRCKECNELLPLSKFGMKSTKQSNPIAQRLDICKKCFGKTVTPVSKRQKKKIKSDAAKLKSTEKCLLKFSKDLRKNMTCAEKRVQARLKQEKIVFVSQYVVYDKHHKYIVDFFLPIQQGAKGIALEIDGGYHQSEEMILKDKNRDDYLHLRGMYVIRMTNEQTKTKLDDLIALLKTYDIRYNSVEVTQKVDSHTIIFT